MPIRRGAGQAELDRNVIDAIGAPITVSASADCESVNAPMMSSAFGGDLQDSGAGTSTGMPID